MLKLFLDAFLVLWTIGCLVRHRYAIVHAHEEAVFFLRFLKPIFRFKLIYDMHSSLPEQLSNYRFTTSRLIIGLFEKLETELPARRPTWSSPSVPSWRATPTPLMPDPKRHFLIENSIFEPVRLAGRRPIAEAEAEATVCELPADRPSSSMPAPSRSIRGSTR